MFHSIMMERLSACAAEIADVMDYYTQRDPSFPARALLWLKDAEKVMSELRLPEGAEMATLRGAILKADDVARDDEGKRTRRAITHARNAAAADSLARGEEILRTRIAQSEDRLAHFEGKLVEAMTAAVLLGLIPERGGHPLEGWLRQVWESLNGRQELRPTMIYMAAALKSVDRLYVLNQVMSRVMERDLPVM